MGCWIETIPRFTNLLFSVLTILGMLASFYFLSLSLKTIPLGTAYAVWTGIGTVGVVLIGIFFMEPCTILRFVFNFSIIVGIIGLKLL